MLKLAIDNYYETVGHNPGGARGIQVVNGHSIEIKWIDPNTAEYILLYKGHQFLTPGGGAYNSEIRCYSEGHDKEHDKKKCISNLSHEELYAIALVDSIA